MRDDITILYVEDEEHIRDELIEILELDFDNILAAPNGEEGLDIYKKYHPDLVISDIQMPKMDGLTMCKHIKELNGDAKVILTTAFAENSFVSRAKSMGIEHYVIKPINIDKLYKCINECLANKTDEKK